jgi:peptide/nickel transport system permease protein
MPPLLQFLIRRLFSALVTFLVITATLYGFVMLTPVEVRVELYMPKSINPDRLPPEVIANLREQMIKRYHLRDPYPVQYAIWLGNLFQGNWGYSPVLGEAVLPALLRRTPVTAELTVYSLLVFIPLGLWTGVRAAAHQHRRPDNSFRLLAFVGTSMPPFILALLLMAIFYVAVYWFPPERLGVTSTLYVKSGAFQTYTGFLTIDGLLNGRADISLEALRHLVLPVVTLSWMHWATLGRVTRATMLDELQKEYILAGRARGLSHTAIIWRHALRNVLAPALTSSALSAATLFTGVFVIERIFWFRGISDVVVNATAGIPDAAAVLGFAVYGICVVLLLMVVLDILQALLDPRVREGVVTL